MNVPLTIYAGDTALAEIRRHGLTPDMISCIFGASGSAKWLAIAGLDIALFEHWMPQRSKGEPVDLFGTSVGAFKLAAAARSKPGLALANLAQSYTQQHFDANSSPSDIQDSAYATLLTMLGPDPHLGANEILQNPKFRFACGAVRIDGWLAAHSPTVKKFGFVRGFFASAVSPRGLRGLCHRTVFADPRLTVAFTATDGFPVERVALTPETLADALVASGSLPVIMPGVRFADAPERLYHDGGLLDYHPIPSAFWPQNSGLTLYPHFYSHLTRRWFDKFFPWHRIKRHELDKVVLIAPSEAFTRGLPGGRIPDRQDFRIFHKQPELRIERWQEVIERSHHLGDAFLHLTQSGDIAAHVEPFPL